MRPPYCSTTRWQMASDSASREFAARVESLEETEDLFRILGLDPDSVVGDRKTIQPSCSFGRDPDTGNLLTAIFKGVADEILEQLRQAKLSCIATAGNSSAAIVAPLS